MKLSIASLNTLAEMICGSGGSGGFVWANFKYRSSWYLTQFFQRCNLNYQHDGTTRKAWVYQVLLELNQLESANPSLPADELIEVIRQLLEPADFENDNHNSAINDVNKRVLSRDGLQVRFVNNQCVIENLQTHATTTHLISGRLLSREETAKRHAFSDFLDQASEDEFTEEVLSKLFEKLGYQRVTLSGHRDKQMEYGKDIWMKYPLPTQHMLYIGVQVKVGRIHASGQDFTTNISGILAQLLMLMTYPVFDTESNSKHLLDHVILVSSGEISKQARTLLSEFLDNAMRRNVLFMDKEDILDLCIVHGVPLPNDLSSQAQNIQF